MGRKSILRRGSFGRKSTTFSFEKDDDSSIQRIVPPCCKAKVAPVAPVKKTKSKEETPVEEEEDPILVVVDTNKETRTEDFVDERSLLPGDDKINMSVTFDSTVDEVSMIPTFDYQVDDEKTIEKSLEITYDNYVEFEKVRKQHLQKVAEGDVSEEATCGESVGEEVEGDDLQGEKFVDELPPILSTSSLVGKLQETEINRIKELKEMNQAEIEKMKSQVQQIKAAMIKRKSERVPIKKTVEKRMKESLELVEGALAAQKKIENEFSLYKVKSTEWQTRFVPPLEKSPSENLTAPPPVQFGMKLRADYEATDDASILVEDDDEKSYKSAKIMSRAKGLKLKPQPSRNGVVRAWNELVEMAEDLRYTFTEGVAEAEVEDDENDSLSSEKSSSRMGFFKNYILQRQESKAEDAGSEKEGTQKSSAEKAGVSQTDVPKPKPEPFGNSVVRAWNELVEMAEDHLRCSVTGGVPEAEDDENESVTSEKSSGRMGFFKNRIFQRQESKAKKTGAEKK